MSLRFMLNHATGLGLVRHFLAALTYQYHTTSTSVVLLPKAITGHSIMVPPVWSRQACFMRQTCSNT